jgi:hypothetical protein
VVIKPDVIKPKQPKRASRKHYGGGLYLQTGESGSASWLLRYQRQGREHWMGLGPKSVFSAKQARARARAAQQKLYDDIDPLDARRKQRTQQALEAARSITFADAAQQYFAQHEQKWSSAKHRQTFLNTLKQYAYPVIGKLPVADVDTAAVLHIVEPIWITKNQTALRVRGRIEAILDWCTVRGYRHGDNPAQWSRLGKVLPTGGKIGEVIRAKYGDNRRVDYMFDDEATLKKPTPEIYRDVNGYQKTIDGDLILIDGKPFR